MSFQKIILRYNDIVIIPHRYLFHQFVAVLPTVRTLWGILGILPTAVTWHVIVLPTYLTVEMEPSGFLCTALPHCNNFNTRLPPFILLGTSRLVWCRPGPTVPDQLVSILCGLNVLKGHSAHCLFFFKRELELPFLARPPTWHHVYSCQWWDPWTLHNSSHVVAWDTIPRVNTAGATIKVGSVSLFLRYHNVEDLGRLTAPTDCELVLVVLL